MYEWKPNFLASGPEAGHHLASGEGLVLLIFEGFCDIDMLDVEREIVRSFRNGREDVGKGLEGSCLIHTVAVVLWVTSWVMPIATVYATSTRRSPSLVSLHWTTSIYTVIKFAE